MRYRGLAAALIAVMSLAGCAGGANEPAPSPAPPIGTAPHARSPSTQPVITPAPRWHPARVRADAPLTPERATMVLAGDTLAAIAGRAGASVGALAAANHLAPPYALAPGQRLIVPAGHWHIVRAGETGIAIARAYGVGWPRVIHANGLAPPYALEVGDRLLIPARVAVSAAVAKPAAPAPAEPIPATVEARAHAFNLDIDALLGAERHPRATSRQPTPPPTTSRPVPLPVPGRISQDPPRDGEGDRAQRGGGVGASEPLTVPAPAIHLEWPLTGRILSAFGAKPGGRFNDGINIAAVAGAPVRAAADGTVAYAGNGVAAFGGLILLRHAGGWLTAYAHCEALLVAKGDTVHVGQPIAKAGATGEVDEPQLHFEVRRGRTPVDPGRLLPGSAKPLSP